MRLLATSNNSIITLCSKANPQPSSSTAIAVTMDIMNNATMDDAAEKLIDNKKSGRGCKTNNFPLTPPMEPDLLPPARFFEYTNNETNFANNISSDSSNDPLIEDLADDQLRLPPILLMSPPPSSLYS